MKNRNFLCTVIILLWSSFILANESDIIAFWDFDTKGNAWNISGKSGNGMQFNGSSYIRSRLDGTYDSLTISLWLKIDELIYPYTSILSTNSWSESDVHLLILQDGKFQFSVNGNDPVDPPYQTEQAKPADRWVHFAICYDSKAKIANYYIDGILKKQIEYDKALPVHLNRFCVGSWNGGDRFYKGLIDELYIYEKALKTDEIQKLNKGKIIKDGLILGWSFNETDNEKIKDASGKGRTGTVYGTQKDEYVFDKAGKQSDLLEGNYKFVDGVIGKAVQFDGYTTCLNRQAADALDVASGFTAEAWIAPQTYPWNWTGIIDQEQQHSSGFSFGIDAYGHIGLQVAIDGGWHECISEKPVELLKWSHIAATYDENEGIKIYINGKQAASKNISGKVKKTDGVGIFVGKSHTKMCPTNTERGPSAAEKSDMIFDGLIDEVKIHNSSLSTDEISTLYQTNTPSVKQPLSYRIMPSGPKKVPNRFGAYYARLEYSQPWDDMWPVGPYADIVVTFDEVPTRVVFWRGMNYAANYITENGIWIGDQSIERGGPRGCYEHMSDKQCRYAHARIIENNDARIVIHWRYAICDIEYELTDIDNDLNWGPWADEYFTIYPDGLVVRHQVLWPDKQQRGYWWQETIFFNQPGTRPEDNVEFEAVTLVNMKGEEKSYSWEQDWPRGFPEPRNPNILLTNLKAKYKHYLIHQPGGSIGIFWGHNALSHFTCWNHWPVAQLPNDGRQVTAFDRPSHTSLTIPNTPIFDGERGSKESATLYGLTTLSAKQLIPLASSWISPAELKKSSGSFKYDGYSKNQKAYMLDCSNSNSKTIKFELTGSKESPIINPAFAIKNWNSETLKLKINGKQIEKGKNFRFGCQHTFEGSDTIVWLKLEAKQKMNFEFEP